MSLALGLGEVGVVGGQDEVEEIFVRRNFESVAESGFRNFEAGSEVVEPAGEVQVVVDDHLSVDLHLLGPDLNS